MERGEERKEKRVEKQRKIRKESVKTFCRFKRFELGLLGEYH
jgi:hypothetical protein